VIAVDASGRIIYASGTAITIYSSAGVVLSTATFSEVNGNSGLALTPTGYLYAGGAITMGNPYYGKMAKFKASTGDEEAAGWPVYLVPKIIGVAATPGPIGTFPTEWGV
jgi:hypothetical protein